MNTKFDSKPIVGVSLIGLSLLMSYATLTNLPQVAENISLITSPFPDALLRIAVSLDIVSNHIFFLGAIVLIIAFFVSKRTSSLVIPILVVTFFGPILSLLSNILWLIQGESFGSAFFGLEADFAYQLRVLATYPALAGFIVLLSALKPRSKLVVAPSSNRFDPMTGEPIAAPQFAQPASTGGAESNLPLAALILAFFVPLAAVIVGHISLSQMKQGLISSRNVGMAKAGLILGYVFIGLGFLLGIIFAVVYAIAMSRGY